MFRAEPVVEMRDVSVDFGGVRALDAVSFRMFSGEIHSLIGENGAGKSTLVKALTGVHSPSSGQISIRGISAKFSSPADAQLHGIQTVYQETDLLPNLSVAENIMLGRERHGRFGINWKWMRDDAEKALDELGLDLDPRASLGSYSLAEQQLVSIARALAARAQILILDEPTSSLDQEEVSELFRVLRSLKDSGVAILFISHFLDQVYEVSDRLTILRDGHSIGEYLTDDILRIEAVEKMVGTRRALRVNEPAEEEELCESTRSSGPFLKARHVGQAGLIQPFDLDIDEGEIVGVAGLLGSGRSELARLLAGVERSDVGHIEIDNQAIPLRSPATALSAGIAYSSDNRAREGIIGDFSIAENILLALQAERGWMHRLPKDHRAELVASYITSLGIRPANPEALVKTLSGGNQQKVLLARWLALAPRLLVLDEPTRGVDMATKAAIQRLIAELASNGMAVIFISAEFAELVRVSDRIAVMRDKKLEVVLPNDDLSEERLLAVIAYGRGADSASA
ncbi:sugar ABC transporter ATP-binding protein [Subtercola sp. PAMC28395]|uniref:sugar ABC transporter ATP-binding protein n=1 Tax=Subtercola sp. PAMC28395 TaxID=2846775 RepID=UPI001C0B6A6D|nr:sugar ABC transporter ATP-binding protein [Subtercola sp. PAMC28395]QWT24773.1 sugar ABC transporter ATP-binding protein [Subtercola sp. PAMC28395]